MALCLPDTGLALGTAEWVRRHQPRAFPQFHKSLFEAHFVLGEDLEHADLGARAPFQAFGQDFVLSRPGCTPMDIPPSGQTIPRIEESRLPQQSSCEELTWTGFGADTDNSA
jgi:hypothetical protein